MHAREICNGIECITTVHWERRLFDSLIPLPDGTSYNAYVVKGSEGTALLDTSDPALGDELMEQLQGIDQIDTVVSHHSEQDHSGTIPMVLARYPKAKLLCSSKAADLLQISGLIPNLKVEVLGTVLHKGVPDGDTFAELDGLAKAVAEAHRADSSVEKG